MNYVMYTATPYANCLNECGEGTLYPQEFIHCLGVPNEYIGPEQIFGMADEVASQFKKLYPEVITDMDSMGYTYDDILFIHMISYNGIKSANAAQSSANSYSSSGGGGGSFGGGGGGGGFR